MSSHNEEPERKDDRPSPLHKEEPEDKSSLKKRKREEKDAEVEKQKDEDGDSKRKHKSGKKRRKGSDAATSYTSSESNMESNGDSSSESSSSDNERNRKRHKNKKKTQEHKEDKKEKKRSEKKKSKKKKSKKDEKDRDRKKKEKKERKSAKSIVSGWGSRGIISTSDMYKKDGEFRQWLVEIKHISPDILSPRQTKEYFSEYVEDYNTATLPHEKYYDIDKWDREVQALREAGRDDPSESFIDIMHDEERMKNRSKQMRAMQSTPPQLQMTKEQLMELKRVQGERVAAEKLRKLGVKVKDSMGVLYETL
ncbi:hypothetical protein BJ742DRAFT_784400 [Cladochytrium replicatum]|nr:hypothetical protein BJ742DRAFT_784400 [Cladochytrium replicatum]